MNTPQSFQDDVKVILADIAYHKFISSQEAEEMIGRAQAAINELIKETLKQEIIQNDIYYFPEVLKAFGLDEGREK